ncbi:hypothetical protein HOY82DRAFT_535263 [Tuber indicum]|nr:hypothetical protein HOY82DRAFT_535263 [Tuber indicum]
MSTGREVRKRAAVKMNGGDFKRRSTARPSVPSSLSSSATSGSHASSPASSTLPAASWKEYLIRQELVDEKRLESKFKAYTLNSRRAKEFRKNLEKSLPDFKEHVTPGFKLQEILQTSKKKQPPEAEISDFAESNEEKLKVLSGKNCFVVDDSDASRQGLYKWFRSQSKTCNTIGDAFQVGRRLIPLPMHKSKV